MTGAAGAHLPQSDYEVTTRTKYDSSIFSVFKVRRPDGRVVEIRYDDRERISQLFNAGEKQPLYTFQYGSGLTTVIDALGNSRQYSFYKRRLTSLMEPHRSQYYNWSSEGQLLSHTIRDLGNKEVCKREYQYDAAGGIIETAVTAAITQADAKERYTVRYTYSQDGRHNLLSENYNGAKEISYIYLPNTNLVTRKLTTVGGKPQEREFFQYDENGILISRIVDDGAGVNVGDLSQVTYRLITEMAPQLDPNQPGMTLPKVVKESFVDPSTGVVHLLRRTEKKYTQGDLLAEERGFDANGNSAYSRNYHYNAQRQLVKGVDVDGVETVYSYDGNGNKIYEEKIGSGAKISFTYDAANRLVKEAETHEDGKVLATSHTYDSLGNKLSTTDHFGQTTHFQYDGASREIAHTDPCGFVERKAYDAQGHVISHTDQDGHVTKTVNNLYGSPLRIQYPDGTVKRFVYNIHGHMVEETERDGSFKAYVVDYQGRPTAIKSYSDLSVYLRTEEKRYKGSNLIAEIDAMGNTTTYQYDGAGRKTATIQGGYVTAYAYDSLGRLSHTTVGERVDVVEYDTKDRVVVYRSFCKFGLVLAQVKT